MAGQQSRAADASLITGSFLKRKKSGGSLNQTFMTLTEKELKVLRLALDPAAAPGEIEAAACKLLILWRQRGLGYGDFAGNGNSSALAVDRGKFGHRPRPAARPPTKPDYGLNIWPWGKTHKGQMFKDIPPYYLRNQLRWIREDLVRSRRFNDLAEQIESFFAQ